MKKKVLVLTIVFMLSILGIANAENFRDIQNHWAKNDIIAMSEAGIVNGRGNGIFDPDSEVTMAEFFAMTTRVLRNKGLRPSNSIYFEPYLAQELQNHWSFKNEEYQDFVLFVLGQAYKDNGTVRTLSEGLYALSQSVAYDGRILVGKGWENYSEVQALSRNWMQYFIMGRYGNDIKNNTVTQKYDKPITREKAAALLGFFVADSSRTYENIYGVDDWRTTRNLTGVNSSYRIYVNEAMEKNVMQGYKECGGLYLRPTKTLTRAEAAALMNRFSKLSGNL